VDAGRVLLGRGLQLPRHAALGRPGQEPAGRKHVVSPGGVRACRWLPIGHRAHCGRAPPRLRGDRVLHPAPTALTCRCTHHGPSGHDLALRLGQALRLLVLPLPLLRGGDLQGSGNCQRRHQRRPIGRTGVRDANASAGRLQGGRRPVPRAAGGHRAGRCDHRRGQCDRDRLLRGQAEALTSKRDQAPRLQTT
jgi:hypothetical protein